MQATDSWRSALARGREVALELGQGRIAPVHMAIAALEVPDELTGAVLRGLRLDPPGLASALRRAAPVGTYEVGITGGPDLAYSEPGVRVLYGCQDVAAAMGHRVVHPLHVLLAVLRDRTMKAGRLLRAAGMDHDAMRAAFLAEVP